MGVPKNVQEQADKADAAIDLALSQSSPSASSEGASSPNADGKPNAEPVSIVTGKPAVEPKGIDLQAELERERQLRKTLEGRLNSQLKPANEEVRKLRVELEEKDKKIHAMEQAAKKPGAERFITEDERKELGEGVLDLNTRMIKGILEEELEKTGVTAVVEKVIRESERAKQAPAEERTGPSDSFWPLVDQYCPGARELNRNADIRWIEYLDLYDVRTGSRNRELAEQAMSDDNARALAYMFEDFMRTNGIAQGKADDAFHENAGRSPKPERGGERRVMPSRENSAVQPWTKAEVTEFYTDVSKGKFKGREAERDKLEANILAAANAGLIA